MDQVDVVAPPDAVDVPVDEVEPSGVTGVVVPPEVTGVHGRVNVYDVAVEVLGLGAAQAADTGSAAITPATIPARTSFDLKRNFFM